MARGRSTDEVPVRHEGAEGDIDEPAALDEPRRVEWRVCGALRVAHQRVPALEPLLQRLRRSLAVVVVPSRAEDASTDQRTGHCEYAEGQDSALSLHHVSAPPLEFSRRSRTIEVAAGGPPLIWDVDHRNGSRPRSRPFAQFGTNSLGQNLAPTSLILLLASWFRGYAVRKWSSFPSSNILSTSAADFWNRRTAAR